jgi:hypothetical protein
MDINIRIIDGGFMAFWDDIDHKTKVEHVEVVVFIYTTSKKKPIATVQLEPQQHYYSMKGLPAGQFEVSVSFHSKDGKVLGQGNKVFQALSLSKLLTDMMSELTTLNEKVSDLSNSLTDTQNDIIQGIKDLLEDEDAIRSLKRLLLRLPPQSFNRGR